MMNDSPSLTSILLEAHDKNIPLAVLLSKVRLVARALNLDYVPVWVEKEMEGYQADATLPTYRVVRAVRQIRHPYSGWIPMDSPAVMGPIHESVYQLEEFLEGPGLSAPLQNVIIPGIYGGNSLSFPSRCYVSVETLKVILKAVRDLIYNWALELQMANVGVIFSDAEKQKASTVTNNFFASHQVIGVAGDLRGNANAVTTTQKVDGND